MTCINCGKKLYRFFGERWAARQCKNIDHLYSSEASREAQKAEVMALYEQFRGRYGWRGDNTFCRLECGYRWGLKIADLQRGGVPQAQQAFKEVAS
jgi:hypothetical protein